MDILFLSGLFQKEKEKEIVKKTHIFPYMAANVHQWCITNGFKNRENVHCELLNCAFVGTYPKEYTDLWIKASKWTTDEIPVTEVGFLNLFGIRSIWRAFALYRGIGRWWKKQKSGESQMVVLYSMMTPFLLAASWAKKRHKELRFCLYVPDLPIFFINTIGRGKMYRLLKRMDCWLMNRLLKNMDCFALLTEQMNAKVNFDQKPYTVIEGIVSNDDEKAQPPLQSIRGEKKRFVYTGKVDIEFGILNLVEAFRKINGDWYELHLYGTGNAHEQLQEASRQDSRIHYYGTVAREVALEKQRNATILINPRNASEKFTEYSFPSKTIEYLLAGRPVLMHPLGGIPNEYANYLHYFPSENPEEMAKAMQELADSPPEVLDEMGQKGRRYVFEQKNERIQGQRLLDLLEKGVHSDE